MLAQTKQTLTPRLLGGVNCFVLGVWCCNFSPIHVISLCEHKVTHSADDHIAVIFHQDCRVSERSAARCNWFYWLVVPLLLVVSGYFASEIPAT